MAEGELIRVVRQEFYELDLRTGERRLMHSVVYVDPETGNIAWSGVEPAAAAERSETA